MPVYQPSNRLDYKLDEITNRLLTVLKEEYGFGTEPLGTPNHKMDMDDKFKTELRAWVEQASLSDVHNSF